MSDTVLGYLAILVFFIADTVAVALWWTHRVRSLGHEFYRRVHEKEQCRRELVSLVYALGPLWSVVLLKLLDIARAVVRRCTG